MIKNLLFCLCLAISCNVFAQTQKEVAAMLQQQEEIEAQKAAVIPKENISKHANTITTSAVIITGLANASKQFATSKLDPPTKQQITTLIASGKSNIADLGMAFLFEGPHGKYPALYLVTSEIIRNIKDTLAINDLGILLKNEGQYEKAIQCFKYVDGPAVHSAIFKSNLGWTSAYYGDFKSATGFFTDALTIEPQNSMALEGMCAIAYAKGDFGTLMQYLAKRMHGGGAAPPDQLLDFVDDAFHKDAALRAQDPFTDHSFDAASPETDDEGPGRSAANGDEEYPSYPTFAGYFFIDPITIDNKLDMIRQAYKQIRADVNNRENRLITMHAALPPLSKPSYTNDYGELVIPHNYEKEFRLFDMISVRFLKRDNWIHMQDLKKTVNEDPYTTQAKVWAHKVGAFTDNDERHKFVCQSADDNLNAAKQKLMGDYLAFNNTLKKIVDNINWYISATSLYIRSVHDVKLNEYLNYKRETFVRGAIVQQYGGWLNACVGISNAIGQQMTVAQECLHKNVTTLNVMGNGDVKFKKLKTWPEECHVPTGDYGSKSYGATISMTCEELKLSFGKGVKLNYDVKFGATEAQDVTRISISGGWSKDDMSKDITVAGHKIGEAELKLEADAEAFITLQNGKATDYGVMATAKATAGAGVKTGEKKVDGYVPSGSLELGGNASWTFGAGFKGAVNPVSISTENIPKE